MRRYWPARESYLTGVANIKNVSLVDTQNILLAPFHVKLGMIKNFVKAMGKSNLNRFAFLCKNFPSIRQPKLLEGIFVGSQIREVPKDPQCEKSLSKLELRAC